MKIEFLEPVRPGFGAGWSRAVRVDGVDYYVSVSAGKRVRIAFKPRGKNIGFHWVGRVVRKGAGEIWYSPDVGKSAGVKGLLEKALRHDFMRAAFGDSYAEPGYHYDLPYDSERGRALRALWSAIEVFAHSGDWRLP